MVAIALAGVAIVAAVVSTTFASSRPERLDVPPREAIQLPPLSMPAPPPPPPPAYVPPQPPQIIAPTNLETRRIRGERTIQPDAATKQTMRESEKERFLGSFKLCVNAAGTVDSVKMLKSTGYVVYDLKLQEAMREWAYRPYEVAGKAVPVCTAVTFVYSAR